MAPSDHAKAPRYLLEVPSVLNLALSELPLTPYELSEIFSYVREAFNNLTEALSHFQRPKLLMLDLK